MASRERLLINEASVATGVAARKINQLLDDEVLPDSTAVKVADRRRLHAHAVPMVSLGATDGSKLSKGVRLVAMREVERYAKKTGANCGEIRVRQAVFDLKAAASPFLVARK